MKHEYMYFLKYVYTLNSLGKPDVMTLKDYLYEYWSDKTTTPKGVDTRAFIKEVEDIGLSGGAYVPIEHYEVREWKTGSFKSKLLKKFDDKRDALTFLWNRWFTRSENLSSDDPPYFETRKDFDEWRAECKENQEQH